LTWVSVSLLQIVHDKQQQEPLSPSERKLCQIVVPCRAVVIYYGDHPDTFSCPVCKAVYTAQGPNWRLIYRFTLLQEWQQYRRQYKALMLPDDDVNVSMWFPASATPHESHPNRRWLLS
jgi:hypothetical protein